jgi:hypothetical protein
VLKFKYNSSYVGRELNVTRHSTQLHAETCIFLHHAYGTLMETARYIDGTVVLLMDWRQVWGEYCCGQLSVCWSGDIWFTDAADSEGFNP